MTQYTRRQFLKTIGVLAAAAGLPFDPDALAESDEAPPVQIAEVVAPAESTLATPVDTKAGYIKINGITLPVLRMTMDSHPEDEIASLPGQRSSRMTGWTLGVTAQGALPEGVLGELSDFELSTGWHSLAGQGYVTQYTLQFYDNFGMLVDFEMENWNRESLVFKGPSGGVIEYTPPVSDDGEVERSEYYGGYWDDEG